MTKCFKKAAAISILVMASLVLMGPVNAVLDEAASIDRDVMAALQDLYESAPSAKVLGEKAAGILVFPDMVKGGFIIGGQYGMGGLIKGGKVVAYYNSTALSYGLQIGAQKFGYALFFMGEKDLDYLKKSDGWEVGSAPSLVIADKGVATALSTTTVREGIYAFFFGQKGLMAGLGLQGTKITEYKPE